MKNLKKCVVVMLSMAMLVGSMNVVMAGYAMCDLDVTPSCSANCDVWCDTTSSSASTHLYLDRSYESAEAYVSIVVTGGRELGYGVLGSDSSRVSFDSDLRALADAVVYHSDVPYKAESYHEASVTISSNDTELTAYYD